MQQIRRMTGSGSEEDPTHSGETFIYWIFLYFLLGGGYGIIIIGYGQNYILSKIRKLTSFWLTLYYACNILSVH